MVEVRIVPKAAFVTHTHNYRKLIRLGIDDDDKFLSPDWTTVVDDAENVASTSVDAEAVAVEVATLPTSTPV